jgi:hypothetical protein
VELNFGHPVSWAVGLGLLAAAIAGSVVPARTSAQEVRHIFGFLLVFAPAVYLLIDSQRTLWEAKHPYLRFVVFTLTTMVVTVALVQVSVLVAGSTGFLARTLGFLAGLGGFVTAAWMTFFGGAERLWELFLDWTDTEW